MEFSPRAAGSFLPNSGVLSLLNQESYPKLMTGFSFELVIYPLTSNEKHLFTSTCSFCYNHKQ
jgi:hypothetical protein